MAVTNYYSVNGLILGEKSTGGSRVDYLPDALGSVTATVNNTAQVVNTYRYKPYGTQLAKTGTGSDPLFRWVGQYGYRQTAIKYSDVYVRARHYSSELGRWSTIDPIQSGLNWSSYAIANPVGFIDFTGLRAVRCGPVRPSCGPDITARLRQTSIDIRQIYKGWDKPRQFKHCNALTNLFLPPLEAIGAWDITELNNRTGTTNKSGDIMWIANTQAQGCAVPDKCKGTVAVDGECFKATVVNYLSFGIMMGLCAAYSPFTPSWNTYSYSPLQKV